MFNDFSKLEVRTETIQEKSDLEKVLDMETKIIEMYEIYERFEHYSDYSGNEDDEYQSLYTAVQEKLANIKITQEVLQKYINARDNTEQNNQARIRGMYSAALLEIISTKTPEIHTFIDGKNKKFNFLFYHIQNVKNLTLTNIQGDYILYKAGMNGSATNITLQHITGENTLSYAGWNGGSAKNITLIDVIGKDTLEHTGLNGSAKNITLSNITGNWTLCNAGSDHGSAKNITLNNITGNYALENAGQNGSIQNILEENILTEKQKRIISKIKKIVKTMHILSLEEQTKMHEKIAELQNKIFAEK